MGKVDLHIHTTASDGKFSPSEIVSKARESGLEYIAICDHDSIEGVALAREAAALITGLTVIGGVEINTDTPEGELHVLGYCYDGDNQELRTTLEKLRNSRVERAMKMIKKLKGLGLKIDYERVEELAGSGSIGRPHIAQALLEKGYINSLREAFMRYISYGGPAYVERDKITPADAISLILRAKGIPVMAHPLTFNNPAALIEQLKSEGLMGLEVYYGNYTAGQIGELLGWAEKYRLVPTGGSDFHGLDPNTEIPLGTVEVPLGCVQRLMAMAQC